MIVLVPIGSPDERALEYLRRPLEALFGQAVQTGDRLALPPEGWNTDRRQHLASALLKALSRFVLPGNKVLGVTDVDLFAPGLNFVFGQADLRGDRAVISLCRLRQEFYGLPANDDLFRSRAIKEAVHELGHTCGLAHCPEPGCVMHFSNSLHDTDAKGSRFCPACVKKPGKSRPRAGPPDA
jgi:archaemetzincin